MTQALIFAGDAFGHAMLLVPVLHHFRLAGGFSLTDRPPKICSKDCVEPQALLLIYNPIMETIGHFVHSPSSQPRLPEAMELPRTDPFNQSHRALGE